MNRLPPMEFHEANGPGAVHESTSSDVIREPHRPGAIHESIRYDGVP